VASEVSDVILLATYFITLVIGQLIAVGFGLAIERLYSPRIGMMAFIPAYFFMFWFAWRVAVRLTAPRAREPDSA
jgi:hypothetical protein